MNTLNAQSILNPTTLLLLGGLVLLLLNIGYGLFRTSRNDVNAGRITVIVVLHPPPAAIWDRAPILFEIATRKMLPFPPAIHNARSGPIVML